MNHPDLLQSAASLKDLCEKVALQLPYKCKVELDNTNMPDQVELVINDWIMIVLFIDHDHGKSFSGCTPRPMVMYSIEHIENLSSHSRDEPDSVDTIIDITVDRPCQAIKEAFSLLVINDLENAIDNVNQEEMIKDEKMAEEAMRLEDQRKTRDFKALFDGL